MNDIHPSTLPLGLPVALEWLGGQFEKRSGIRCTLTVAGDHVPLQDPPHSVIFRIVQEALVHVLSHASACAHCATGSMCLAATSGSSTCRRAGCGCRS